MLGDKALHPKGVGWSGGQDSVQSTSSAPNLLIKNITLWNSQNCCHKLETYYCLKYRFPWIWTKGLSPNHEKQKHTLLAMWCKSEGSLDDLQDRNQKYLLHESLGFFFKSFLNPCFYFKCWMVLPCWASEHHSNDTIWEDEMIISKSWRG